jgi:hypothetical protein
VTILVTGAIFCFDYNFYLFCSKSALAWAGTLTASMSRRPTLAIRRDSTLTKHLRHVKHVRVKRAKKGTSPFAPAKHFLSERSSYGSFWARKL